MRAGGAAKGASAAAAAVALAPGERGLRLNAFGQYRKLPVRIEVRTSGVLGLLVEGKQATAQPLRLIASVGRANLSFEGSTTDPLHFAGLQGRFVVSGASLAAIGDPLGVTLPTTPAFKTRGTVVKDGGLWKTVFDEATIGSSRLAGAFTYESRRRCRCSPAGHWLAPGAVRPRPGRRHERRGLRRRRRRQAAGECDPRPQVRPAVAAGDGRQRPDRHRHVRPRRPTSRCGQCAPTCCSPTAC